MKNPIQKYLLLALLTSVLILMIHTRGIKIALQKFVRLYEIEHNEAMGVKQFYHLKYYTRDGQVAETSTMTSEGLVQDLLLVEADSNVISFKIIVDNE